MEENPMESVTDSMVNPDANSVKTIATTSIPAKVVERLDTESQHAPISSELVAFGMRPKYLRHNIWDPESELTSMTAEWSETAIPLPQPPQSALEDPVVTNTIHNNPHLFSIVTPINVEVFEAYLSRHPNRPFVESICCGLREGFWPWANTHIAGYPTTHNESRQDPVDPIKSSFLATQLAVEQSRGRFSEAFGSTLLPGMYCMPIYAVPKPNSTDLCLVTDQSYGSFSLNSMTWSSRPLQCMANTSL